MLMLNKTLTAEQRLHKNVAALMAEDHFAMVCGVIMCMKHTVQKRGDEKRTQTAMTNGLEVVYDEEFVETLTDPEFRFVIMHEVYHCIFKHLMTWQHLFEEDANTANIACDYAINIRLVDAIPQLSKDLIQMPKVGLVDARFRGMDSGEIYRILRKEQKQQPQGGGQPQQGQGQGQPQQGQGQPQQGQGQGQPQQGFDDHDWEGAQEMSAEDKAEAERKIDEALRQGALLAGKVGSGGDRELQGLLEAKVRWQDALREYVQEQCAGNDYSTWKRPNRRYLGMDIYMPSGVSERVGDIVVAVDTSGSIGGEQIKQFLGEIDAIAQGVNPESVWLLYWDTEVCRAERYIGEDVRNIVQSTKPAGGGGTTPSCVTRYMYTNSIRPKVAIVLTDGYVGGDWGGEWACPVVWCIVGNRSAEAAVGKTLHVDWN